MYVYITLSFRFVVGGRCCVPFRGRVYVFIWYNSSLSQPRVHSARQSHACVTSVRLWVGQQKTPPERYSIRRQIGQMAISSEAENRQDTLLGTIPGPGQAELQFWRPIFLS